MARLCLIAAMAAMAAIGSTGPKACYSVENRMTLMPDGSGAIDILISQKPEDEKDLKEPFDLLAFAECTKGVAAFSQVKTEIKDGWRLSRFTAYFEDVNKVYYNGDGAGKAEEANHDECVHFSLERPGEGFALTMEDWAHNRWPGAREGMDRKDWDDIRKDSENVVTWSITLPGKVTKIEKFQRMEGREAVYERSPKTISTFEDAVKWPLAARRRVECGKSEVTDAEVAAFRKKLELAKNVWSKLEAHLRVERAKKAEREKK